MVARMRAAGAIDQGHARTLAELGIKRGVILRRLRERAVIRQAQPDHFYLDEESWNVVRRQRRRAVSVIVAIAMALALALIFTRRAHAQSREVEGAQAASLTRPEAGSRKPNVGRKPEAGYSRKPEARSRKPDKAGSRNILRACDFVSTFRLSC